MIDNTGNDKSNNNTKFKRTLALCTVVFIVAMVLITLVAAITTKPGSSFFLGMIGCIIFLPVIAYVYMIFIRYMRNKKYDASLNESCDELGTELNNDNIVCESKNEETTESSIDLSESNPK